MRTQSIGAVTIDRVVENGRFVFKPNWLFANLEAELILRHRTELGATFIDFATNGLILSFHSYLIRTPNRTILVDTCNGNHKDRPGVPWQHMLSGPDYLANLAALGLRAEDIDIVLCTHLHGDHVGWNTRLVDGRWVPTFPRAKYVMALEDYRHFSNLPARADGTPAIHLPLKDSVLPVIEADQAQFIETRALGRHELGDGVWIEGAPGHTPGHVLIHVEAQGAHALLSGDIIHHPIQILENGLHNIADVDPDMARRTRQRLLATAAGERALLLTGHFPTPTAGFVTAHGDGFRFAFAEPT
jgi:glyoxylase-like metal-dependent hydrolase (beta-lactamase superfamily II)